MHAAHEWPLKPAGGAPTPPRALTTEYVMGLIHAESLSPEAADRVMAETLAAWTDHVNPGFLKYRKSVADDFAAIEWRDGEPGGATVVDARGNVYIDCLGGFGIYACGHGHPVIVEAVAAQMRKQSLHSQELLDPLRAYCAALLARTLPGDLRYAFFTNSGTESVEACLKFAMLASGRRHFIGVLGAFHGKTLGSLSGTSKSTFRKPFAHSLLPFTHVPVNDVDALRRAFEASRFTGNEVAGFIVEPVLGEGGIHVCSDDYLRAARALCDEYGAALIFDEVQSGMGRTGTMWACQHAGVAPDLMAIGKAFGGGVTAAGAAVGTPRMWERYLENPFLFTTTFGGSPVAMAAAIAALHVVESEGLAAAAAAKGERMLADLRALASSYPRILKAVRGRGLMIGLEFHDDDIGYAFSRGVFARGVLLSGTLVNSRVLRVEPPLTITEDQVATVLARFADTLAAMMAEGACIPAPATTAAPVAAAAAAAPSACGGGAGASPVPCRPSRGHSIASTGSQEVPHPGGKHAPAPVLLLAHEEHAGHDPLARTGGGGRDRADTSTTDDTEVSSVSESSVEEAGAAAAGATAAVA